MQHGSTLAVALSVTFLLLVLTYINVYTIYIMRRKQYEYYRERERWKTVMIDERDRIMAEIERDVHDNLGQLTHMLYMTYHRMFKDVGQQEHDRLRKEAADLINIISEHVRDIGRALDTELHARGLVEMVRRDVERLQLIGGPEYRYNVTGEPFREMDKERELMTYRIVQESLHNALKHSEATLIQVDLYFNENVLSVSVEDNGNGFDDTESAALRGIGLSNMETRAEQMNAVLNVNTKPGRGTRVTLTVPDLSALNEYNDFGADGKTRPIKY